MDNELVLQAIEKTMQGRNTFCKFLSANDSGETGGHQSGILISTKAKRMFFTEAELLEPITKHDARVYWFDGEVTDSKITWYTSKGEIRLTQFGRGFELLRPEYTGALFVFVQVDKDIYYAWLFNTDDEIQEYLDAFGLTPVETNNLVDVSLAQPAVREQIEINRFLETLDGTAFPSTEEMSFMARSVWFASQIKNRYLSVKDPDSALVQWTDEEYTLFQAVEKSLYGDTIRKGFQSVSEFISLANQLLNRRKSRAGKSFEHHLAAIFDDNKIIYTAQGVTEGNKKPDFIFPSIKKYHDFQFPVEKLCTLAAKTTCKDRWRQVINEADRLRDHNKFLCTLQQGTSSAQLDEMKAEKVILVVPKPYIAYFPREKRSDIWTLSQFVNYIKAIETDSN